jgi:Acetyl-CoA hydrolase/transferase C-terminal domain
LNSELNLAEALVTEYGIADLHRKSVRERTLALIHVAHPKFRDELLREARERRLVHPDQISLPPGLLPYPRKYETTSRFKGGLNPGLSQSLRDNREQARGRHLSSALRSGRHEKRPAQ